jgi:hypothetical protein
MKKLFIFLISGVYSSLVLSQPLTVDQVRSDIDTIISVLSGIHPTFSGSANRLEAVQADHEVKEGLQDLLLDHDRYLEYTPGLINNSR